MGMLKLSKGWHRWIVAMRNKIAMGCQLDWSLNGKAALNGDNSTLKC